MRSSHIAPARVSAPGEVGGERHVLANQRDDLAGGEFGESGSLRRRPETWCRMVFAEKRWLASHNMLNASRLRRDRQGRTRFPCWLGKGGASPSRCIPSEQGLSRPVHPRRRAFLPLDPDHGHGGQPCAGWMRGNGVSRCIDNQGALPPDTPASGQFAPRHQRAGRLSPRHPDARQEMHPRPGPTPPP